MNSNTQHFRGEAMLSQSTRTVASHPMRELLNNLRQVQTVAGRGGSSSIPMNMRQPLTENAEIVMAVCQNGMAALGQLLAYSSPVIEDGTVGADSVEALGWLIAELGDLTAYSSPMQPPIPVQTLPPVLVETLPPFQFKPGHCSNPNPTSHSSANPTTCTAGTVLSSLCCSSFCSCE